MRAATHYDTLRIDRDARSDDLHRAYVSRVAELRAREQTLDAEPALVEAWQTLNDPAARAEYDAWLDRGAHGRPPSSRACIRCGAVPTADVSFTHVRAMLVVHRTTRVVGPMCRDCGVATGRLLTDRTLVTGWWGFPSLLANLFAVAGNILSTRRVTRLAPPRQRPGASLAPEPLDRGRGLVRRGGLYAALAFAALVALAIVVVVA